MKKANGILSLLLIVVMMFTFCACNGNTKSDNSNNSSTTAVGKKGEKSEFSKPDGDTAGLIKSFGKSESDEAANKLRKEIKESNTKYKITGRTFYVSMEGNDKNDGKSEKTAWKTISRVNSEGLTSGDAILFRRGDVFRGRLVGVEGVTYGAYGNGDKPCIYGAEENAAMCDWSKTDIKNVYLCSKNFRMDVGLIVFNHGEVAGQKRLKDAKSLDTEGDFYYDAVKQQLYVYSTKGSPDKVYYDIEVCMGGSMLPLKSNMVIDNLCFKYAGAHCLNGSDVKNTKITNCEIGWIGGCYQSGSGLGANTRYGNAIEFWGNAEDILVDHNYIYQIFDAGVTNQYAGEVQTVERNITYSSNLIDYCVGSFEVWNRDGILDNIVFENNVCRYAGYGFGSLREGARGGDHVVSPLVSNSTTNFYIRNNYFDSSKYALVSMKAEKAENLPIFENNVYIQRKGSRFGIWFEGKTSIKFDDDIAEQIKSLGIDKNPTVYFRAKDSK